MASPYGDTFVNQGNPGQNYANYQRPDSPTLYEMWLGESPSNSTYKNTALIKFDISSILGYAIDAAELPPRPYHAYYDAPTARGVWAYRIGASWTETVIGKSLFGLSLRSSRSVTGIGISRGPNGRNFKRAAGVVLWVSHRLIGDCCRLRTATGLGPDEDHHPAMVPWPSGRPSWPSSDVDSSTTIRVSFGSSHARCELQSPATL